METIVGIDLGTTNSAIAIIQDGRPVVLRDSGNLATIPSVVGFGSDGQLLVGQSARNQALIAPERTVKSIKRRMGKEEKVRVADRDYSPQEISAMILRTLKDQAESRLGQTVSKAVITVPAYFNDNQRTATREAGELAGLEVVRIINEPTAATLTYEPHSEKNERLLIYDLGGGTFDVSIVQIEQGVVEVLSSHGDTHLGGDDFDQLLLDHICDGFQSKHGIDLRTNPVAKSRLLQAAEAAKIRLSDQAFVTVTEEFIAEKDGQPLHLEIELGRREYEDMIAPLLKKTIDCVDAALEDARLAASEIDRVILVGGSSRTPMVHRLLKEQLDHDPHLEIDPDLCVAMGASVQGALIAGVDVGTVLVDITPHTLGIRCLGELRGRWTDRMFSAVIPRNTALPATRSEVYYTCTEGQKSVIITVLQGEHEDVTFNESIGEFSLEGLREDAAENSEILVRFDLNLDGILTVTAIERETGLEKRLIVDNAMSRFRGSDRDGARTKLAEIFGDLSAPQPSAAQSAKAADSSEAADDEADALIANARRLLSQAAPEDADEIRELISGIRQAAAAGDQDSVSDLTMRLEDLLFYVEDV
ncbi:MAG: Hsp70 family protein [Planctomycetaceae bacterium]